MNKLEVKNYIDVTEEWLRNAKPNSHQVKEARYFEYEGKKYYVDNKNVILDYSKKELEIACWLEKTFGGEIYMLPRINKPDGIKTADYLWNNEYWDLKEIKSSGKRTIDNRINGSKRQTHNFILSFSKSSLDNQEIISNIHKIYISKDRKWVGKIIIINNNYLLKVFKRKRLAPSQKYYAAEDQSRN